MSHGRTRPVALLPLALLVVGCATAGVSTQAFDQPTATKVENEVVINKPFDEVWDRLVGQLSKSFYVINNIDKASRIVNVSFTSDTPELYVDCGRAHRTFTEGENTEEFDYEIAASSSYKYAGTGDNGNKVTSYFDRKTSLEGRMNVYVAPESAGTRVAVNARYVLTMETRGTYKAYALLGPGSTTGSYTPSSSTLSFNTDQPVTKNLGTAKNPANLTCRSNGKLEEDILNLAK